MSSADHSIRRPTQKRSIETRKRIIAAAQTLFSEKGFHSTQHQGNSCRSRGCHRKRVRLFQGQEQIFVEVLKAHITESKEMILEKLQAIDFSGESVHEAIYQLIKALYASHDLSPAFHREAEVMRYSDADVAELHQSFHDTFYNDFAAFLTLHQDRLRVTDLEAAAYIVMSASEEIVHASKIFGTARIEGDRMLSGLADMICRFLLK